MLVTIVDDDAANVSLYKRFVARIPDTTARGFTSSSEALAWCTDNEPDMVIVDYRMPAPDGLAFIREYRALHPHAETPIVMITADVEREVRRRAFDLGASDFLIKPPDPIEFIARIRNLLALRQSRKALTERAATLAYEVARVTREIADREEEMIHRLMRAAEYRDDQSGMHVVRMGHYASLVAARLRLPVSERRVLLLATPMLDIGKSATPDEVLLKPGPLTAAEWEVMRDHATAGHRVLRGSSSYVLQTAADIALRHHEWWDGTGYPDGLSGSAIPLSARIAAVCDVFEALVSNRPYKPAWPADDAFAEIAKGSGTQFDPAVVTAFLASRELVARVMRRFADAPTAN